MNKKNNGPTLRVIVVEDSRADFELIKVISENMPFNVDLLHFENGTTLFNHLRNHFNDHFSFFLIDLKNPGMGGKEILRALKATSDFAYIPSIIFSSSNNENDISECAALGANAYVLKPVDYTEFELAVKNIFNFWGRFNVLRNA